MAGVKQWIILQTRENADDYFDIEKSIKQIFGKNSEYFIPILYQKLGSYNCFNVLFDGYVFIRDTEDNRRILSDLSNSKTFLGPVVISNRIQTVDSYTIAKFKRQLKKRSTNICIENGKTVYVMDGIFENLSGEVIGVEENKAIVRFVTLSREFIAPIPISSLKEE